jgi:hypothetical protein
MIPALTGLILASRALAIVPIDGGKSVHLAPYCPPSSASSGTTHRGPGVEPGLRATHGSTGPHVHLGH